MLAGTGSSALVAIALVICGICGLLRYWMGLRWTRKFLKERDDATLTEAAEAAATVRWPRITSVWPSPSAPRHPGRTLRGDGAVQGTRTETGRHDRERRAS